MTAWRCRECRAQVAPGAPRCPECPSTSFDKPEADMSLKIARDGSVSDSAALLAAAAADEQQIADTEAALEAQWHPGTGVPMEGIEHPADGTMSPPLSSDEPAPAAPPRVPPRRTPPPGASDG